MMHQALRCLRCCDCSQNPQSLSSMVMVCRVCLFGEGGPDFLSETTVRRPECCSVLQYNILRPSKGQREVPLFQPNKVCMSAYQHKPTDFRPSMGCLLGQQYVGMGPLQELRCLDLSWSCTSAVSICIYMSHGGLCFAIANTYSLSADWTSNLALTCACDKAIDMRSSMYWAAVSLILQSLFIAAFRLTSYTLCLFVIISNDKRSYSSSLYWQIELVTSTAFLWLDPLWLHDPW